MLIVNFSVYVNACFVYIFVYWKNHKVNILVLPIEPKDAVMPSRPSRAWRSSSVNPWEGDR